MAGLDLDPWQEFVLEHGLGERPDGKWAAFEVGLVVPRQNGKGAILEARELVGLFLLKERLIIHSAHEFATSLEAFRRLLALIEERDEFSRRVKRVSRAHGEEGIELTTGQRVRFRTRTSGGGRGFSGDCLILDEAMILPEAAHGALLPTLSARPNPQVWYTGSAVDREVHDHGIVFGRVRARGVAGDDGLAFFEWSSDTDIEAASSVATDISEWGIANPGLGIRIGVDHVALEQRSMDPRTFAVERLGIGDWPNPDADDSQAVDIEAWRECADRHSLLEGELCFAFDVKPDRSSATIAAAGVRSDGLPHVEVIEHRPGTGWLADRLLDLTAKHESRVVVCDKASPAAALLDSLQSAGVAVEALTAAQYAAACGVFFDAVDQRRLRHLDTAELNLAVRSAAKRALGDAFAWSRKRSRGDISPLVACTLALHRLDSGLGVSAYEEHVLDIA